MNTKETERHCTEEGGIKWRIERNVMKERERERCGW